jgi:hypothetical protein
LTSTTTSKPFEPTMASAPKGARGERDRCIVKSWATAGRRRPAVAAALSHFAFCLRLLLGAWGWPVIKAIFIRGEYDAAVAPDPPESAARFKDHTLAALLRRLSPRAILLPG